MTPRKLLHSLLTQKKTRRALTRKPYTKMPSILENDEGVQVDVQIVTDEIFLPVEAHRPSHRVVEAEDRHPSEVEDARPYSRSRKYLLSAMNRLKREKNRMFPKPENTGRSASMEDCCGAIESGIGHRVMLGGRKHCGYYPQDTMWPFPIKRALRAMEDRLIASLDIQPGGGLFLDAGCGEGHVAIRLARQHQVKIHCVDIVERHVLQTERNITRRKLEERVTVEQMDYHNLGSISELTFDGVFAMETLRHAQNPNAVLRELFRLLKGNGTLVLHELARSNTMTCPQDFKSSAKTFISLNHINIVREATLKQMVEREGFEEVVTEDISINIMPLLRLFFTMAYIPAFFTRQCGLQGTFVNQTSAVTLYRGIKMGYWKYLVIKGKRPGGSSPWKVPNPYA